MKPSVLIKSNKQYGITVILDDQITFEELVIEVEEKFKDSGKFYSQVIARGGVDKELFDTYVAKQEYDIR